MAIHQGAKKKAPGLDGITAEFYQVYRERIKEDLTKIIADMYERGSMLNIKKWDFYSAYQSMLMQKL
jgi:hypothetical protein